MTSEPEAEASSGELVDDAPSALGDDLETADIEDSLEEEIDEAPEQSPTVEIEQELEPEIALELDLHSEPAGELSTELEAEPLNSDVHNTIADNIGVPKYNDQIVYLCPILEISSEDKSNNKPQIYSVNFVDYSNL